MARRIRLGRHRILQAFRKAKCQGSQNGRKSISDATASGSVGHANPVFMLFDIRTCEVTPDSLYSISLMGNPPEPI